MIPSRSDAPGAAGPRSDAPGSPRDRLRRLLLSTGWGWRLWMRRNFGGRLRPLRRPGPVPACAVLGSREEIDRAVREVAEIGLPSIGVEAKFWDGLSALAAVLAGTTPAEEVLDAGAELYSPILPWLSLYGYRRLRGSNLVFKEARSRGPIVYEHGDVTSTEYADGRFSAVTCMSVIEHGVDPDRFFPEMARIIRAGGTLVISTDYWEAPLDPGGRTEFGVPVKVFDRAGALRLLESAAARGLEPVAPLSLDCGDPVIRWNGLDYTFLVATFRKRG